MTQQARRYQLEHAHTNTGVLTGRNTPETVFKYGLSMGERKGKTTLVHGLQGSIQEYDIETVEQMPVKIGDTIELSHNGKTTKVIGTNVKVLDELQLRFVPYEKADKIITITVSNLED